MDTLNGGKDFLELTARKASPLGANAGSGVDAAITVPEGRLCLLVPVGFILIFCDSPMKKDGLLSSRGGDSREPRGGSVIVAFELITGLLAALSAQIDMEVKARTELLPISIGHEKR